MSTEKNYFTVDDVRHLSVKVGQSRGSEIKNLPATEVGREVLRSFKVDFDEVNRAFDRAMKRHG